MIADLILALFTRRIRVYVDYTDNVDKHIAYLKRSALIHAADPLGWEARILAGRAVKAQARQSGTERRARKVVSLHRSKRA